MSRVASRSARKRPMVGAGDRSADWRTDAGLFEGQRSRRGVDSAADRHDGARDIGVRNAVLESYELLSGDTLSEIAAVHSIPVQALLDANPAISSPDDVHAGQIIEIPASDAITDGVHHTTVSEQTQPS